MTRSTAAPIEAPAHEHQGDDRDRSSDAPARWWPIATGGVRSGGCLHAAMVASASTQSQGENATSSPGASTPANRGGGRVVPAGQGAYGEIADNPKEMTHDDDHPGRHRHHRLGRSRGGGRRRPGPRAGSRAPGALRPQGRRPPHGGGSREVRRSLRLPRPHGGAVPRPGDPDTDRDGRRRRAHRARSRPRSTPTRSWWATEASTGAGGASRTASRTWCCAMPRAACSSWTRGERSDATADRSRGGTPAPP